MSDELHMEEKLWSYIDGSLNGDESSFIENLVRTDASWQARYNELLEVHTLMLDGISLEQPSMRFTQNVMEEISRLYITPAASNYINKNVVRGIVLFFLTSIIALLVYSIGQTNWSAAHELPGISNIDLRKIDWSRFYNSTYTNIFMMINIVLALMLADMYLAKRRRAHSAAHQQSR